MKSGLALFLVFIGLHSAFALGPHEILLLANGRSADSIEIAKAYAELRGIPERNIVRLSIPFEEKGWNHTVSPGAFTKFIWKPATRIVQERGLENQILAWVYSVDFPIRISTATPLSIQGITFLRNQLPDPSEVRHATYSSPLFAGPSHRSQSPHHSQSFDRYKAWLREEMPLPSMMLGHRGKNGNTLAEIRRCLRRGAISDGTHPAGAVYFIQTEDVRSRCRHWQHEPAFDDLRKLGLNAVIAKGRPKPLQDLIGLQMGEPDVEPSKHSFLPGAMAEHLTSAAAVFHSENQTKLSAWIRAGATASCGTVTEPYAIWEKFPSAHFYFHYASGCTMIESLYQSVKSPLQILLVGEPLASPWGPRAELKFDDLEDIGSRRTALIKPVIEEKTSVFRAARISYMLDDEPVHEGESWTLDISKLVAGEHRLRVVATGRGLVGQQVFHEQAFKVDKVAGTKGGK
jgi:uncharacterized protein (TIGR03790 family)